MSDPLTGVIPADIHIDAQLAEFLIRRDFPQLALNSIGVLGEGFDNLVFLIDEMWVFRFPRRAVAVSLLEQEIRILNAIKGRLELEVPEPHFIGAASPEYPSTYYGHKQLLGTTGCSTILSLDQYRAAATQLGRTLRTLHDLDYQAILNDHATRPFFDRTDFSKMSKSFGERSHGLRSVTDPVIFDVLVKILTDQARIYQTTKFSLIHGDLYHRHLIFSEAGQLVGLIDWGDAGVSDPIVDLCVLYQFFPPEVHASFFETYGRISDEQATFAQYLALYYAITLYWYGESRQDANLMTTSITTLGHIATLLDKA